MWLILLIFLQFLRGSPIPEPQNIRLRIIAGRGLEGRPDAILHHLLELIAMPDAIISELLTFRHHQPMVVDWMVDTYIGDSSHLLRPCYHEHTTVKGIHLCLLHALGYEALYVRFFNALDGYPEWADLAPKSAPVEGANPLLVFQRAFYTRFRHDNAKLQQLGAVFDEMERDRFDVKTGHFCLIPYIHRDSFSIDDKDILAMLAAGSLSPTYRALVDALLCFPSVLKTIHVSPFEKLKSFAHLVIIIIQQLSQSEETRLLLSNIVNLDLIVSRIHASSLKRLLQYEEWHGSSSSSSAANTNSMDDMMRFAAPTDVVWRQDILPILWSHRLCRVELISALGRRHHLPFDLIQQATSLETFVSNVLLPEDDHMLTALGLLPPFTANGPELDDTSHNLNFDQMTNILIDLKLQDIKKTVYDRFKIDLVVRDDNSFLCTCNWALIRFNFDYFGRAFVLLSKYWANGVVSPQHFNPISGVVYGFAKKLGRVETSVALLLFGPHQNQLQSMFVNLLWDSQITGDSSSKREIWEALWFTIRNRRQLVDDMRYFYQLARPLPAFRGKMYADFRNSINSMIVFEKVCHKSRVAYPQTSQWVQDHANVFMEGAAQVHENLHLMVRSLFLHVVENCRHPANKNWSQAEKILVTQISRNLSPDVVIMFLESNAALPADEGEYCCCEMVRQIIITVTPLLHSLPWRAIYHDSIRALGLPSPLFDESAILGNYDAMLSHLNHLFYWNNVQNIFASPSGSQAIMGGISCALCRQPVGDSAVEVLRTCGHVFHPACAQQIVIRYQECPLCHDPIVIPN